MLASGLSGLSNDIGSSQPGAPLSGTSRSFGSRLMVSSRSPVIWLATSTSPVWSSASRVAGSGTPRMTIVLTFGALRQYSVNASSSSSVPAACLTNLYGPAPIGACLKPFGPTFS